MGEPGADSRPRVTHQPGTNSAENLAYLGRILGVPKILGSWCGLHHLFNRFPTKHGSCFRWRQCSFLVNWGQWGGRWDFQTVNAFAASLRPSSLPVCTWAEGQCPGGWASAAHTSIWLRTTWSLSGIPFFMVFLLLGLVSLAAHQSWVLGKSCHCRKQGGLPKRLQGLSRTSRKRDNVMPYLATSRFVVPEGIMLINSQRKALLGALVSIWRFPLELLIDISELRCRGWIRQIPASIQRFRCTSSSWFLNVAVHTCHVNAEIFTSVANR